MLLALLFSVLNMPGIGMYVITFIIHDRSEVVRSHMVRYHPIVPNDTDPSVVHNVYVTVSADSYPYMRNNLQEIQVHVH